VKDTVQDPADSDIQTLIKAETLISGTFEKFPYDPGDEIIRKDSEGDR
jgi:hypothetical protein